MILLLCFFVAAVVVFLHDEINSDHEINAKYKIL